MQKGVFRRERGRVRRFVFGASAYACTVADENEPKQKAKNGGNVWFPPFPFLYVGQTCFFRFAEEFHSGNPPKVFVRVFFVVRAWKKSL